LLLSIAAGEGQRFGRNVTVWFCRHRQSESLVDVIAECRRVGFVTSGDHDRPLGLVEQAQTNEYAVAFEVRIVDPDLVLTGYQCNL
jgi:hypothetical protein